MVHFLFVLPRAVYTWLHRVILDMAIFPVLHYFDLRWCKWSVYEEIGMYVYSVLNSPLGNFVYNIHRLGHFLTPKTDTVRVQ